MTTLPLLTPAQSWVAAQADAWFDDQEPDDETLETPKGENQMSQLDEMTLSELLQKYIEVESCLDTDEESETE